MGNPDHDRENFACLLNNEHATKVAVLPPRIFGERMRDAGYPVMRRLFEERKILRAIREFIDPKNMFLLREGNQLTEHERMLSEIAALERQKDACLLCYAEGNGDTVDPIYFRSILDRLQFLRDRICPRE
jgi:hypothetical protein